MLLTWNDLVLDALEQAPSIVLVYDAIIGQPSAKQQWKGLIKLIVGTRRAQRIRYSDKWRIEAHKHESKRVRFALRTEKSGRAAATKHEGGRVVDVDQHTVVTGGSSTGGKRLYT